MCAIGWGWSSAGDALPVRCGVGFAPSPFPHLDVLYGTVGAPVGYVQNVDPSRAQSSHRTANTPQTGHGKRKNMQTTRNACMLMLERSCNPVSANVSSMHPVHTCTSSMHPIPLNSLSPPSPSSLQHTVRLIRQYYKGRYITLATPHVCMPLPMRVRHGQPVRLVIRLKAALRLWSGHFRGQGPGQASALCFPAAFC